MNTASGKLCIRFHGLSMKEIDVRENYCTLSLKGSGRMTYLWRSGYLLGVYRGTNVSRIYGVDASEFGEVATGVVLASK